MEVCLESIFDHVDIWDRGGLQTTVRNLMGDDYDLIPREVFDEEDLTYLSPTNFKKPIPA